MLLGPLFSLTELSGQHGPSKGGTYLLSSRVAWSDAGQTQSGVVSSQARYGESYFQLGLITFTGLNLINCKTFTFLHHPHCCYVYIPGTTCLHIPLAHPCLYYYVLSPQYTVLHILFYCTFYSLFLCCFF